MSVLGVLLFFPLLFFPQGIAIDETQIRFYEAMELAPAEGIPSLVRKLDSLANTSPSSPFIPQIYETIYTIGLLHPGSVPDLDARLTSLKAAASGNPGLAKTLKRIDILQSYFAAAAGGQPEIASAALSDPVFEGSPAGIQAQADAALRAGDYGKAAGLALQVIESDPYSPLLSNAYMTLGLSCAYQGNNKSALTHFQHALAASELPTIYGNPRDYVFTTYRFSRAVPTAVGDIFDESASAHLSVEFKEPQSILSVDKGFILLDKEMMFTVSTDGQLLDKVPVRKVKDIAAAENGKVYSITEDRIDLGGGSAATLSLSTGTKMRRITSLRSVAAGIGGDLFFLDEDAGLLRGTTAVAAGSLTLSALAPVKGRLIRTDRWGNVYVLDKDQKSILVLSRDGKPLTGVSADPVAGKTAPIEYFALDSLNHLYILASNSIQIFAMKNGNAGVEKKRIGMYPFDQRPQFRNLKVLGVNAAGELVVTGKNENNWVCFK